MTDERTDPAGIDPALRRLVAALNTNDPEQVADCFTEDYRRRTPVHPAEAFDGRSRVYAAAVQLFVRLVNLRARLVRATKDAETGEVWSEWALTSSTRTRVEVRGVMISRSRADRIAEASVYWEEVDAEEVD